MLFKKKKNVDIEEENINEYDEIEPKFNIDGDLIDPQELKKAELKAELKAKKKNDDDEDNAVENNVKAHKKKKAAFFSGIAVLTLVVLLIASYLVFTPDFKVLNGSVKAFFASMYSDSYPVSVDSDSVHHFVPYKNGFIMLADTSYSFYNSSGNTADTLAYDYASPQVCTAGRNVLIYDRGDTKLRIKRGSRTDSELTVANKIITCDITKSGYYAVAALGDESASAVTVFSDRGERVFQWNCAEEYTSTIALSSNNKKIAVAVTGSKNAQLLSKLHVFDFKYNESYVSMDINDVIVDLCYVSSDKIFIVGRDNIYLLNDKVLTTVYSFTNDALEFFELSSDGLCILTRSGADSNENNVIRFDKNGTVKTRTKITGKARGFSATDYYASVLLSDSVVNVGYNGEISGTVDNIKFASGIAASDSAVYVLSVNSVEKFSPFADSSQQKNEHTTGIGSVEDN